MRITKLYRRKEHHSLSDDETKLLALEVGTLICYKDKKYIVKKIIEYNWGEIQMSYDYILDDGNEISYLGVEKYNDRLLLSIKNDIAVDKIDNNLKSYILKNEVPPRVINYNTINYQFDRESIGKSRLENSTDWTSLTVWEFIDKKNCNVLTIEQYSDKEIFTSIGVVIDITNISF